MNVAKSIQLHVWLSEDDHQFLAAYAASRGESVGQTVRRVIRHLKRDSAAEPSAVHDTRPLSGSPGAVRWPGVGFSKKSS